MPVVNITMSHADKAMKKKIISNVTKTLSETIQMPEKAFTVIIDEKDHDSIGLGGQTLSELMK
ncbi:4-oxalocrotonate tautomerase [Acidaminobacter sp. JC074]|uniref:tautomerase family protein n=1 Tax=Acidaminobacter sp. JC074 TaxID=2530199 RepID=UPI001F0D1B92|nr:tautomerase family protein [Acidaminobacter sp. JC074]MCH4889235.1 4-oxalocrotonate tautomerase [Acidaminobacter sp. JC074]